MRVSVLKRDVHRSPCRTTEEISSYVIVDFAVYNLFSFYFFGCWFNQCTQVVWDSININCIGDIAGSSEGGKDSFSDWLMHTVLRIHTKFNEHSIRRYFFSFVAVGAVAAVIVFNFCFIPFCTSGPFISHRHYGCNALFRSLFSYLTHDCFGDFFLSTVRFSFSCTSVSCAAFCCLLINTACS